MRIALEEASFRVVRMFKQPYGESMCWVAHSQ